MATVQIVPTKSVGTKKKDEFQSKMPYANISASGDALLEIFRQLSIRLDRPIIGHHLKVIIISADLLQQKSIEQLTDFLLRDNDIRPSTMVFISQGLAKDTLVSNRAEIVPSFHIMGMHRNLARTSKLLPPQTLSKLDGFTYARKNFVLQNLVAGAGEVEFSGAGIIKGATGHWIGNLSQQSTECLVWLRNEGTAGVIKTKDQDGQPLTYELKSMESKMESIVEGERISFRVNLSTEGRMIETWNDESTSSSQSAKQVEELIEEELSLRMQTLMDKLQKQYKADVGSFGERLAIQHPQVWRKVKDNWDDVFSQVEVDFHYKVKVTDFGSFSEDNS